MVKNFEEYINEDYFSKLANRKDNGKKRMENEITEDFVRSFVYEDCEGYIRSITIRKENNKTFVDIDGDFFFKNDIEEIPFQFGKVTGDFSISDCKNLTSLEGCPKEVGGDFYCDYCENLASLEGCPEMIPKVFDCSGCGKFTSLEGCPEIVGGDFYCAKCKSLKTLEGCPKEVGGIFDCRKCGKQFTEDEVNSLCNVKGNIYVW